MTANRYMITSSHPLNYEQSDDSTDLGTWLRSCYPLPCACVTGELGCEDRRVFEAAYVANRYGADYTKKLAEQSTREWQESDFGKVGREIAAEIGFNPFDTRKRGRPVEQNDRLLIKAVASEWRYRGLDVRSPSCDPISYSDRPTDFSRACERYIKIIDPARKRMPGRQVYKAALAEHTKTDR